VYMVFDGFCGVYRDVWNEHKQKHKRKFLLDAKRKTQSVFQGWAVRK